MRHFKLFIAAISALGVGAASAADLPARTYTKAPPMDPAYNWSGWYVGLNAGGAWGSSDPTTSTVVNGAYFSTANGNAVNAAGPQHINSSGFTGGGQIGYNWQSGGVVAGIEADLDYLGLSGFGNSTGIYPNNPGNSFNINSSVKTDALFTLRPRVGFAINQWLLYGTGGLAVAQVRGNFIFTDNFGPPGALETASISKTRAGWTVGAGAEYKVQGPWSLKVEYLYVGLGSMSTTSTNLVGYVPVQPVPTQVFTHSVNLNANVVRVGFNYKIN